MKKQRIIIAFAILLAIMLLVVGCGEGGQKEESKPEETRNEIQTEKKEETKLPEVSETAIEMTKELLMEETLVKDVHIEVKKDKIIIAIIVNAATNDEYAKELCENGVRFLASMSSDKDAGLKGPSKNHLGDIYNYYDLSVGVGPSPDNFIQGAKDKTANRIFWDK